MDRALSVSLIISLSLHTLILLPVFRFNFLRQLQFPQKIEVTYLKAKLEAIDKNLELVRKENLSFRSLESLPNFIFKKEKPIPDFVKEDLLQADGQESKKLALIKDDAVKKKVELPLMESANIKNPVYRNYFQSIRSKIKQNAYRNYSRIEEGQVYLTFLIDAEGQLKEARIIDEKSAASDFLKQIALKSIKESSPYPPFPKDLDYPQLSFNVIISFELE